MGRHRKTSPIRPAELRSLITLGSLLVITLIAASGTGVNAAPSEAGPYTFNFEGNPSSPQPWNPATWDVAVTSRDTDTFPKLEGMQAQHGADCSAPPATHFNSSYEGAVFICRNHMMTAIKAGGYGEIALTPDHMVDIRNGHAQVSFDVSTYRASFRDWWDLWFTPFADNLVLPIELGFEGVDLQGPPKNAIHIRLDQFNDGSVFHYEQYTSFQSKEIEGDWWTSIESLLTPSMAQRSRFQAELSATHLRFGMSLPGGGSFTFADADLPTKLSDTQFVVQLAHHSYNPTKDCPEGTQHCMPNTWHWSDFAISNAAPFTLLRGDPQTVNATDTGVVNFPGSAPAGSFVRFAGIGSIDVSVDGGKTWQSATRQAQSLNDTGHFASYWTPVPAGTKRIMIRGRDWWAGPWWVRDISIWSTGERPPSSGERPPREDKAPPAEALPTASPNASHAPGSNLAASGEPMAPIVTLGLVVAGLLTGAGLMVIAVRRNRAWARRK